jgi:hypothetical protein
MRSPTHAIMQPPERLLVVVVVGEVVVVIIVVVIVVVALIEILMTLPYMYLTISAKKQNRRSHCSFNGTHRYPNGTRTVPVTVPMTVPIR